MHQNITYKPKFFFKKHADLDTGENGVRFGESSTLQSNLMLFNESYLQRAQTLKFYQK